MKYRYCIYNLRKEFGMSSVEFSKYIGVNQATFSSWESGKAKPGLNAMRKLESLQKDNHDLDVLVNWKKLCEKCKESGNGDFRVYALKHGIEANIVVSWEKGKPTQYDVPAFVCKDLGIKNDEVYCFAVDFEEYHNPYPPALISELIRLSGITHMEFAKQLGVTKAAIAHWCNGANSIALGRLELFDTIIDSKNDLRVRAYNLFHKSQEKQVIHEHPQEDLDEPLEKEVEIKPADVEQPYTLTESGNQKRITATVKNGEIVLILNNDEYARFSVLLQENIKSAVANTIKEFI